MKKNTFRLIVCVFSFSGFTGCEKEATTGSQDDSSKPSQMRSGSEEQGVRSTSRVKKEEKKIELPAEDKAIYRAQGILNPDEVDPNIHIEVGRFGNSKVYTEKIDVDPSTSAKIVAEILQADTKYDSNRSIHESSKRYNLSRLILDLAKEGILTEGKKDVLTRIIGKRNGSYKEVENAIAEVIKYDDAKKREKIANEWSLKIPVWSEVSSVKEAHQIAKKRSSFMVYLPKYFETDTHFVFFFWNLTEAGYAVRKKDGVSCGWKTNPDARLW